MDRPYFFRYDIIGVNTDNSAQEVQNILLEVKGILQVSLNNEYKLVYIEMKDLKTIQEFNDVLKPKYKLDNQVNIGFLMRFFP